MDDAHRLARDRNSSYQFFENQRRSTLKELIPSEVRHRLTFHLDECWFVHFSPSGEFLASAGLDHSIILWKDLMSPEPSVHMTLSFDRTVTQLGWSPDGQYLLVNHGYIPTNPDFSYQLRLIEVKTGETVFTRIQRKSTYTPIISDIAWFPDSQRFLAADDNGRYTIWNIHGDIVKEYTVPQEVASCYIKNIPGTENFVVSTVNNLLEFHSFEGGVHTTKKLGTLYQPTALSVSSKGRYVVVTERENDAMHRPANLIVYDLHSMTYLRSFEAQTFENKNFVIFPAFTGPNEEILSSGSENGKLHFWDIESGELIMVLEEHSKHSGCNSTSPVHPGMMASCSDDNHIIIWVTKELQNELQELDEKWFEKRRQLARPTIDIKKGW
ncbi:hypothetical protein FBU30_003515 [Linnemannia zychae]|nr:hypothetical protein FBU30_003515 [Linnemannia zychae]